MKPSGGPVSPPHPAQKCAFAGANIPSSEGELLFSRDSGDYSLTRDLKQGEKAYKSPWFYFPLLLTNAGSDNLWLVVCEKDPSLLNHNIGNVPMFSNWSFPHGISSPPVALS